MRGLQIVVKVELPAETQRKIEETLDISQQTLLSLQELSTSLEFYARIQMFILLFLAAVCVLVLVILIVRDHQLRGVITSAWRRLWHRG